MQRKANVIGKSTEAAGSCRLGITEPGASRVKDERKERSSIIRDNQSTLLRNQFDGSVVTENEEK
jgi:hypothetical protein